MSGGLDAPVGAFEGSYLGAADKISALARMECKVCWTPYEPEAGDETRQIEPGTPFRDLPGDWKCPVCDAPKAQFMVLEDPGAATSVARPEAATAAPPIAAEGGVMKRMVAELEAEFREIHASKMRDTPFANKALSVQAVDFRPWSGRYLGVLLTPWFMNLVILPGAEDDWSVLKPGVKEHIAFPSGTYEFIHNVRQMAGGYKACSLFSPMGDFNSQLQATDVARAAMAQLFNPENRAETDRSDEIREARTAQLTAERDAQEAQEAARKLEEEQARPSAVSRRALLGGADREAAGVEAADAVSDDASAGGENAPREGDAQA